MPHSVYQILNSIFVIVSSFLAWIWPEWLTHIKHKLSHAIRCLRRHLEATSRTITSTAHTFHTKVRVNSWTVTIWATEGLTPVIRERRLTTQPFHRLKKLCLVPFSVINDVIMTSLLLVKVTYTLATTWFYQTTYYSLRVFRLMCIWEKIGFWQ